MMRGASRSDGLFCYLLAILSCHHLHLSRFKAALAEQGVMRPHISHRFPLDQAADALRVLETRSVIGRAVITM